MIERVQRPLAAAPSRRGWGLAVVLAGGAVGLAIGLSSWGVALVLTAGAFAGVLPWIHPPLALYVLFAGLALTTDAVGGFSHTFFAVPDADLFQGLPPLLTTYLVYVAGAVVLKDLVARKVKPAVPLKYLGIYSLLLLLAAAVGVARGNEAELLRVDFMGLWFPALCFYLCAQVLDSEARNRRMLLVLFGAASLKAVILLAYYFAGRGWPYGSNPETAYRIATMDSADLLVAITVSLAVVALWATRRVKGWAIMAALAGTVPLGLLLLFAFRRAQWVGAAASLGLMFLWMDRNGRRRLAAAGAAALLVGASLVVFLGVGDKQLAFVGQRTLSILDKKQDSNRYHLLESQQTMADIAARPVTGMGLGGRHSPLGLYEDDEVPTNVVHNAWLYVWMKMGLPGFLFFAGAAVMYLRRILRSGRLKHRPLLLALASSFGLWMAMFLTGPVPWYLHQTYFIALFAAMALTLCRAEGAAP